jgi:hypothetical protein
MDKTAITKQLEEINGLLAAANPVLATAFGAYHLVREMFRREASGAPALSLAEQAAILKGTANRIVAVSETWFDANPGYDRQSGSKLDA